MKKKLAAVAALTALAMTLSACVIISVQKPAKDDKPDHHVSAGQTT